ncbi:MAG: transporter [Firmicutes bacterium]|nr:transporter [Bacillota bacterium]
MFNRLFVFIFMITIFCCSMKMPVYAARPLITEDAPTNGKGVLQFEAGQDWVAMSNKDKISSQTYTLSYGITKNIDFAIDKTVNFNMPFRGNSYKAVGDSTFSLKYRFQDETKYRPALGVKLYADICDGDDTASTGETEYQVNFFATRNVGFATFHANLGATLMRPFENSKHYILYNYNLAFEKPLNDKFTIVGEILGTSSAHTAGPAAAQLGFTYQLSPNITLDAGYTRGLNSQAPRGDFTTGVTIQF